MHEARDLEPGNLFSPLPKGLGSVAVSSEGIATKGLQKRASTEIRELCDEANEIWGKNNSSESVYLNKTGAILHCKVLQQIKPEGER